MHSELEKVYHEADLCVVGGGLAGICASIGAARRGSRVVLMQDRPTLGGNASSEIRMWVCGSNGENNRETGIMEEIALENLYSNPQKSPFLFDCILFDKIRAEANITLLLNCSCLDAETEGLIIKSVTGWQGTTQQYHIVKATLFADCSGDSILAPLTGAMYRYGREAADEFGEQTSVKAADRKTMGISCLLQARLEDTPSKFIPPAFARRLTDEEVARRMPHLESPYENFWYLELGGEENCIGDTEYIRDRLLALALGFWDYIKNSGKVANTACWKLEFVGFLPAKRESRRMVGKHILTQSDILSEGRFFDTVAYGGWGLDDHYPGGFFHRGEPNVSPATPAPYGIPYRCLYSANIENLFFAGRNISATHAAMSSTRVMATCAVMGQAVGNAAALCKTYACLPDEITEHYIGELQQSLLEDGCFLPRIVRQVNEKAKEAKLVATDLISGQLDRLRNGIDRNNRIWGVEEQGVTVKLGSEIIYELAHPTVIDSVRLTFDSDLDRKTLPGDPCERRHITRCNLLPDSPVMHMPTTLVKHYRIYTEDADGNRTFVREEDCNRLCTVTVPIGKKITKIIFVPLSKWETEDGNVTLFAFDCK